MFVWKTRYSHVDGMKTIGKWLGYVWRVEEKFKKLGLIKQIKGETNVQRTNDRMQRNREIGYGRLIDKTVMEGRTWDGDENGGSLLLVMCKFLTKYVKLSKRKKKYLKG